MAARRWTMVRASSAAAVAGSASASRAASAAAAASPRHARDVGRVIGLGEGHLMVCGFLADHHRNRRGCPAHESPGDSRDGRRSIPPARSRCPRVVRGLRHRQQLVVERLAMRAQVAARVRRGAADQRAVNPKTRIEQVFVAPEIDRLHPVGAACSDGIVRALVDGTAVVRASCAVRGSTKVWRPTFVITPGLPPAMARYRWVSTPCGRLKPSQVLVHGQRGQPRGRAPVTADDGPGHAGIAEVDSFARALLRVALAGRIDQRRASAAVAVLQEARLQRLGHFLGVGAAKPALATVRGAWPISVRPFWVKRGFATCRVVIATPFVVSSGFSLCRGFYRSTIPNKCSQNTYHTDRTPGRKCAPHPDKP